MGGILSKVDPDIKTKWIDALRSGEYGQATGMLKGPERCFCCLGVLADISGAEWHSDTKYSHGMPYIDGAPAVGINGDEYLREGFAGLSRHTQEKLAEFNYAGKPFTFIADYIEREL